MRPLHILWLLLASVVTKEAVAAADPRRYQTMLTNALAEVGAEWV